MLVKAKMDHGIRPRYSKACNGGTLTARGDDGPYGWLSESVRAGASDHEIRPRYSKVCNGGTLTARGDDGPYGWLSESVRAGA